jgi:hypothetical protein
MFFIDIDIGKNHKTALMNEKSKIIGKTFRISNSKQESEKTP